MPPTPLEDQHTAVAAEASASSESDPVADVSRGLEWLAQFGDSLLGLGNLLCFINLAFMLQIVWFRWKQTALFVLDNFFDPVDNS